MQFDLIVFLFFMIFGIGFIVNVIKKINEMSGGTVSRHKPQPPEPSDEDPRIKRIRKERDELKYGFPMPPPSRTWVKPQPVIEKYAHEKVAVPAPQPPIPVTDQAAATLEYTTVPEQPKEELRLESLLKDQDPILQGVLMSIILNPPRGMRKRPCLRSW